jgi:hypothetical protein
MYLSRSLIFQKALIIRMPGNSSRVTSKKLWEIYNRAQLCLPQMQGSVQAARDSSKNQAMNYC